MNAYRFVSRSQPVRTLLTLAALCFTLNVDAGSGLEATTELQQRWAEIKYRLPEKQQESALEQLTRAANQYLAENPDSPELLIWKGIILSTYAGAKGGLGALSLVKEAKQSFEQALAIDPEALSGSAYTSLGVLYYQVPGWPISFGNDKKARQLLSKALEINPNGIDSNYFYADFLVDQKDYILARQALDKALQAPGRPNRPLADTGRRQEILDLLAKIGDKAS
ncbi:MAG: tetratricopeptide (TPR) repeat protein [Motiliproteus sp.]|jgi:tetratricopeptide (TPR) repeat protein